MKHDYISQWRQMELTMAAATLIGAGVAAAGTGGQMILHGKSNKKTREWNERMYGVQRGHALEDWNRTNQYNSPTAQKERLKEAGLNPAMMYGQQGAGGVTAQEPRGADVKPWNPQIPNIEGMGIQGAQMIQQIALLKAQKENIEADTAVKLGDAANKPKIGANLDASTKSLTQGVENQKAVEELTQMQTRIADLEQQHKEATFNDSVEIIMRERQQMVEELKEMRRNNAFGQDVYTDKVKTVSAELAAILTNTALTKQKTTESEWTVQEIQQKISNMITEKAQMTVGGEYKGREVTEKERQGAYDRFIHDMQQSFGVTMEVAKQVAGLLGLKELMKGGSPTPVQGFRRQ